MQLDQSENFFTDDKQGNLQVQLSKYTQKSDNKKWIVER